MEWKTIAEDSAKKAKTQRRRQEIPSLSVMTQFLAGCRCSLVCGNPEVRE